MKKTLALVLAMVLTLGCFAFASAEEKPTYTFTLLRRLFDINPDGTLCQETWEAMMEEYIGAELEFIWDDVPNDYNDKLGTYLASGDWADAFLMSNTDYASAFDDYGSQGMFANIKDYLGEDSYYMQYLASNKANELEVTSPDGGIYRFGVGMVSYADNGTQVAWTVRADIFEENGIAIPDSMEGIYEAAKQLKEIYPDSYPVIIGYGETERWFNLYNSSETIMFDGEKYVFGPRANAEDNKAVLEYLHTLYAEELMDPEYITDGDENFSAKFANGNSFINSWHWASGDINSTGDTKWVMIAEPKTLDGNIGYRACDHYVGKTLSEGTGTIVNAKAENIDILMKIIDYQYSDEMIELTNWGIEGVTFYTDENGEKWYTDEIMNAENPQQALGQYGVNQSMCCRSGILYLPQENDAAMKLCYNNPYYYNGEYGATNCWSFSNIVFDEHANRMAIKPASYAFTDEQHEDASVNLTALNTFVSEQYAKFISGDRSLDEYDAFLEEMNNYGDIDLVESIYNECIAK